MNKPSLVLLALVTVGLGSVIYFQHQKIADLQRLVASTQSRTAEVTAKADRDREELDRVRSQNDVFKKESEQLRAKLATDKSQETPAAAQSAGNKSSGQDFMKGLAKMFSDPEMKKSMRMQQMVGIRMMYSDLAKELGLSAEETEQLFEILADRQMDVSASAMANIDPNAPNKEENTKKITDTQKRYTEQLEAVLGEERHKKFQTYEGSIGDRFLLQQFEGQFAASGAPLEKTQKEQLLTLMRDERAKNPTGRGNLLNTTDPNKQFEALKSDEAINEFVTTQKDFNTRVLTRARDILSADQIATFEKVQQQQIELMKTQVKMSREFLGVGK